MKALVVGAGIGGLATAIALQRNGIDVEVFERAAEIREVGAGLSLWANALHALAELGLSEAVTRVAYQNPPAGLLTWTGAPVTPPMPADLGSTLQDLCVVMHRAELLSALLDGCGRANVRLGSPVVRFEQDTDGAAISLADGTRVHGDLLVGADGLHSVVRAGLHGDRPPTYAGYTAWRGVVSFDTTRVLAAESWGFGARFGQVPMSHERVYWFATTNTPEGGRNRDEKAALLEIFRGWHDPIGGLIEAADPSAILRNDIYDRPVLSKWGKGRVTLVGDAAHPMTPNLGQGGCQALEDAVVLGKCLHKAPDVVAALARYEAARIPRANPIVIQSRRVGALAQWQNPIAVRARNALFRLVSPRLQLRYLQALVSHRV